MSLGPAGRKTPGHLCTRRARAGSRRFLAMRVAVLHPDLARKGELQSLCLSAAGGLLKRGHEVALVTSAFDPSAWFGPPGLSGCVRPAPALGELEAPSALRRKAAGMRRELDSCEAILAFGRAALHASHGCTRPRLWFCSVPLRRLHLEATDRELIAALAREDVDPAHPALALVRSELAEQRRPLRRWRQRVAVAAERRAVAAVDVGLVATAYGARCFRHSFERVPEVVQLGLPDAPQDAGTGAGTRRGVVVVGGGDPHQNLYGALAAVREACRQKTLAGAAFDVIGPGSDAAPFRHRVRAWGLDGRVRLLGDLAPAEASAQLRLARLCLFLPLCEPMGLPAVEALCAGTPVLASDHGGPAEFVARTGGGAVVDPLAPAAVAETLASLLDDDAALRSMGERGRQAARALFGMDGWLDLLERALRRAVARERVGSAR